jgi:hypothetical protein
VSRLGRRAYSSRVTATLKLWTGTDALPAPRSKSGSRKYSDDEFLVHSWCTLTCKWGYVCATESSANYWKYVKISECKQGRWV